MKSILSFASEYIFFRYLPGPFTIFAPSDFAFSKLGLALMNSLANDYAQLRKVLEYHVVNGFLLVPMIQGTVSKQTIEGQSVIITNTPGQVSRNTNKYINKNEYSHSEKSYSKSLEHNVHVLYIPKIT